MADPTSDHRGHDLEAIAALVDDRSPEGEARRTEAARCADCASLLEDLRLLATATTVLTPATRTRDFRLDPATAARLSSMASEPERAADRLGQEMPKPAADHAAHDPVLVSAYVDGRLDGADRTRVDGWLAGCGACAELRQDLDDLVVATRALPTPSRPRDFTLSPEEAHRARAGGWRRLIAAIGSPRDTFSKPLAVGLTTLGIAGLIVATVPSTLSFGSAAGSAPLVQVTDGSAAPAYVENAAPGPDETSELDTAGGEPPIDTTAEGPVAPSDASAAGVGKSSEPATRDTRDQTFTQSLIADGTGGPSWLVIGSALLLLVGLTLALLRWGARRLGDG